VSLEWTLLALRLLAVAVLYAFLIIIVYVIWRDLGAAVRAQPQDSQAFLSDGEALAPPGRLRVVSGGEAELHVGDVFDLRTHTTLGRAPDNHVILIDTYVSSYHARVDRRDDEWWLTDLDSRNGTLLNGVPITKSVPLAHGDVIGVGQVEMELEIEELKIRDTA
jgi:hypothetical protein